jgi:hypothetical protein
MIQLTICKMIEVEVTEEKKQEEVLDFPCLMKSEETDAIILATSRCEDGIKGTLICEGSGVYSLGAFSNDWSSKAFKLLPKGTEIKLKNE